MFKLDFDEFISELCSFLLEVLRALLHFMKQSHMIC